MEDENITKNIESVKKTLCTCIGNIWKGFFGK